ncbi:MULTISPECIES: hypothetical protein [Maricaulis]|nr:MULTISPECIES: hypothetical protein [Maricaulis]
MAGFSGCTDLWWLAACTVFTVCTGLERLAASTSSTSSTALHRHVRALY